MKKIAPLLLIALSGSAIAADSPSSETVTAGIAKPDWQNIHAAHEA